MYKARKTYLNYVCIPAEIINIQNNTKQFKPYSVGFIRSTIHRIEKASNFNKIRKLKDELDQSQADKKSLSEENEELKEKVTELSNIKEEKEMAKKELSFITEKLSTIQARLDNAMAREVQLESEMVQEKRARLDECRGRLFSKVFFFTFQR